MNKHKHHVEIKAWADGATIEGLGMIPTNTWHVLSYPLWHEDRVYRVKKEPRTFYILLNNDEEDDDVFLTRQLAERFLEDDAELVVVVEVLKEQPCSTL